jgi:uncharacterized protein (TIGR03437 family)
MMSRTLCVGVVLAAVLGSSVAKADTIENLVFTGTATCLSGFPHQQCTPGSSGAVSGTYTLDVTSQQIVGAWSFTSPFGSFSSTDPGASAVVNVGAMNSGVSYDIPEFFVETSTFNAVISFGFTGTMALSELGAISTPQPVEGVVSGICQDIPGTNPPGCEPDVSIAGSTALAAGPLIAPGIIPIGSSLTFGGTNAPDTYTATTTFSSTPVLVDNGAVKIWQEQTPTGSTGEWDVFYMETTNGGPVAGNIDGYWNILMNYDLSQPVYFDQVVQQWLVNGTAVSPITNGIGSICCAATSNPILPGAGYYNSGFQSALPAGIQTNWQQIFVTPYNIVSDGGINASTANGFAFALHFTLQSVPLTTALGTDFVNEPFASQAIVTAFGSNLASGTQGATTIPLPTLLEGASITVTDSTGAAFPASLYYASPNQINYEIPEGLAIGAATVTLTPPSGTAQTETIQIANLSPGLFVLNSTGLVAAWVLPINSSGVQQPLVPVYQLSGTNVVPLPINLSSAAQIYLELYGTGIRNAMSVGVTINNVTVPVPYAGAAPGEIGEDQINVGPLPPSLAGSGSVSLVLTADGQAAATVNLSFQ